jgi:hypothetical protein
MPCRWVSRVLLCASMMLLAVVPTVVAQQGAPDEVVYRDPETGKIETVRAVTKESTSGISYTEGKASKSIAAKDILRVDYGVLPGISDSERFLARSKELDPQSRKDTHDFYTGLLKKAGPSADEKTRRVLSFREAVWAAKVADELPMDDFTKEAPGVVTKLEQVVNLSKQSWESWPATEMVSRIYTELGQHDKAANTWAKMAATTGLPAPLKLEAQLAEVTAKIRGGGGLGAEALVGQIASDPAVPATGAIPDRITILKVASKLSMPRDANDPVQIPPDLIAKLEGAIAQVKDPVAKAVGYNFLGDARRLSGNSREAIWSYLWVDVVFDANPTEHLYALHRIIDLFEQSNDPERVDQFQTKLPRVR